jgi:hypothetical protein
VTTTRRFKTLADYSQATGQGKLSVMVDYDIFVKGSGQDTGRYFWGSEPAMQPATAAEMEPAEPEVTMPYSAPDILAR